MRTALEIHTNDRNNFSTLQIKYKFFVYRKFHSKILQQDIEVKFLDQIVFKSTKQVFFCGVHLEDKIIFLQIIFNLPLI